MHPFAAIALLLYIVYIVFSATSGAAILLHAPGALSCQAAGAEHSNAMRRGGTHAELNAAHRRLLAICGAPLRPPHSTN